MRDADNIVNDEYTPDHHTVRDADEDAPVLRVNLGNPLAV
jgi:hypothetical protein